MAALSIAFGIDQSPRGMKYGIVGIDCGVLIPEIVESVLGFGKILFRCRELLLGQPPGSREWDDLPVFEAFIKGRIHRPVFPKG